MIGKSVLNTFQICILSSISFINSSLIVLLKAALSPLRTD